MVNQGLYFTQIVKLTHKQTKLDRVHNNNAVHSLRKCCLKDPIQLYFEKYLPWSSRATVVVMAFLLGAVFALLLLCLLFIIRLYVVVKAGSSYKPGTRGPVSVLVVAGSGTENVKDNLRYYLISRAHARKSTIRF